MEVFRTQTIKIILDHSFRLPRLPGTPSEIRDHKTERSDSYDGSDTWTEYPVFNFIFAFRFGQKSWISNDKCTESSESKSALRRCEARLLYSSFIKKAFVILQKQIVEYAMK